MSTFTKYSANTLTPRLVFTRSIHAYKTVAPHSHRSGYATVSQPSTDANASKLSTDMWKNYNVNLRHIYLQNGKFDPKTQVFYTAPIGSLGIPAGGRITTPYTNFGVATVADTLLDVKNPIFTPGTGSYIERQKRNTNQGAEIRLLAASDKEAKVQAAFDDVNKKATAAFDADSAKPATLPFSAWVSKNYPQYDNLHNELQEAAAVTVAAKVEVYGPGAAELNRKITGITKAMDIDIPHQGYNMPVITDQASITGNASVDPNAPPEYRPVYKISSSYTDAVNQWIANNASNSASAKHTTIDISTTKFANESWEQSGFSNSSIGVAGSYDFITARASADVTTSEEHSAEQQLWAGAKVSLKTSGSIKAFDIKAGPWDGDFVNLYSKKNISLMADFDLPEACAVTTVIMGYNVSFDVSLGAEAAQKMQDLYKKAVSGNFSISFFGIPIGFGPSHSESSTTRYAMKGDTNNFTNFSIAPEDSGYPVVLGVVGRRLKAINADSH